MKEKSTRTSAPTATGVTVGLAILVVVTVLLSLALPIGWSGIWEPHELETAEMGRRLAVGLWGNDELRLDGALNTIPTQRELGRGELPFTSIALGFHTFGLRDWAGRLPLVLWALVGVIACCGLTQRISGWRSAMLAALVLATMPLYFVQARMMLGHGVAMAGSALALWGLVELCWPRAGQVRGMLVIWGALSLAGLAVGALSVGGILGVGVPLLAVGLSAWLAGSGDSDYRRWLGMAALGLGALVSVVGGYVALRSIGRDYSAIVGMSLRLVPFRATHEEIWRSLGHALFPWSGAAVVAFGLLFSSGSGVSAGKQGASEVPAGLLLVVVTILTLAVHGIIAPHTGAIGFVATPAIAVAIAVAFNDMDQWRRSTRVVGVFVIAITALLALDIVQDIRRSYAPFCLNHESVPTAIVDEGKRWIVATALAFMLAVFLSLQEPNGRRRESFRLGEYVGWPRTLMRLAGGDFALALGVAEAMLLALAFGKTYSDRVAHWPFFEEASHWGAMLMKLGWILLPALVILVPWGAQALRDVARLGYAPRRLPASLAMLSAGKENEWHPARAGGAIVLSATLSLGLSLGYYPRLLAQNSVESLFDSYLARARPGEPIALLGIRAEVGAYRLGEGVLSFERGDEALAWLVAGERRRWLALRASELAPLNAAYRSTVRPATNLPILETASSQMLLATNESLPSVPNGNPLARLVLSTAPRPRHSVSAVLNDELEALGWEIRDASGRIVDAVVPGRRFVLRLFWRVLVPPSRDWTTFVHVDGFQRRFNGDHEALGVLYPMEYWQSGDYIVDEHEFSMSPHFAPGSYQLYFGMFHGSQRLPVTSGDHQENRVKGGSWLVR